MADKSPVTARARLRRCRGHPPEQHRRLPGLPGRVAAAIVTLEHELLWPGAIADALRDWRHHSRLGYAFPSYYCGDPRCCGPGARQVLEDALRGLPRWARGHLYRQIRPIDDAYRAGTLPNPLAPAEAPWWERRT